MKTLIEFKNVSKQHIRGSNTLDILTNLNFNINEGELVVIKGYIHSGKKTMFNLIGGLDRPTEGKIIVNNNDIETYTDTQLKQYRKDNIGFIVQSENLIPNMTIQENFELLNDNVEVELNPESLIVELGLSGCEHKYPLRIEEEPQQYRISRTLNQKPKILLCYEPTLNDDTITSTILINNLIKLRQDRNTTIIIVTENDQYTQLADKIINLKRGQIEEISLNKYPKNLAEINC